MSVWRNHCARVIMTGISLCAALVFAVPPKGICLREVLLGDECCMDSSDCPVARPVKVCCDNHAAPATESPVGLPLDGTAATCFVTPDEPYLSPAVEHTEVQLVAVDLLLPPGLLSLVPANQFNRVAFSAAHAEVSPPESLSRGSSILRI